MHRSPIPHPAHVKQLRNGSNACSLRFAPKRVQAHFTY